MVPAVVLVPTNSQVTKVDSVIIAMLTRLFMIKIVAKRCLGFSRRVTMALLAAESLSLQACIIFSSNEKKATSEPEINADRKTNKIKTTPLTTINGVETFANSANKIKLGYGSSIGDSKFYVLVQHHQNGRSSAPSSGIVETGLSAAALWAGALAPSGFEPNNVMLFPTTSVVYRLFPS